MTLHATTTSDLLAWYEAMKRIRTFEDRVAELYSQQEMKTPVHLCTGQEAVAVGVCRHLSRQDYLFSNHRSHGHCIAKGMPLRAIAAELYGREAGCARGRGGSMHLVDPDLGIPGTTAIVGGALPLAVGAALSSVKQKNDRIVAVFFGDGASEEGSFHESLNFAALHRLPVIFICENNYYATNSPLTARQPSGGIAIKGNGYGIPSQVADGNCIEMVFELAGVAVERARSGNGPTLLEFETYRWKGHVGPENDVETGCRPAAEYSAWLKKCPLESLRTRLLGQHHYPVERLDALDMRVNREIDDAFDYARCCAPPDPAAVLEHVC